MASLNLESIRALLKDELDPIRKTLQSLEDGQKKLEDGQKSLEDGQKKLEEGQKKLKAELVPIKKTLQDLEAGQQELIAGKVATCADRLAKRVTVAIGSPGMSSGGTCGHGLLIKNKMEHYLLSAAHIVVGFAEGASVRVQWSEEAEASLKVSAVFLPAQYIEKGTHDIGLAKVDMAGVNVENLEWVPVDVHKHQIGLGNVLIGHGLVFICGRLVHVDRFDHRAMIQAISPPGCSGCPLFDSTMKLAAVVHGDSKHRHHRVDLEEASHSVFADLTLFDKYNFKQVKNDKEFFDLLGCAEGLSREEAAKPNEKFYVESQECPRTIRAVAMRMFPTGCFNGTHEGKRLHEIEVSWSELMEHLSKIALIDNCEVTITGESLMCLAPKAVVDKYTQGGDI